MFEDAYFDTLTGRKSSTITRLLPPLLMKAAKWAVDFVRKFGFHQQTTLPWFEWK